MLSLSLLLFVFATRSRHMRTSPSCDHAQVYELRDASWFDRGTGHCKGVYDDQLDVALLVVEAEVTPKPEGEAADADQDEPGGFLKEGEGEPQLLLRSRVEKGDCYTKQQGQCCVTLRIGVAELSRHPHRMD